VIPVQLLGTACPKPFPIIVQVPRVEVGHLRPIHDNCAAHLASQDRPSLTEAYRRHEQFNQATVSLILTRASAKFPVYVNGAAGFG
jgi:hypothetical protein